VLDYQKYFKAKVGNMPLKKMTVPETILFFWGFNYLMHSFCRASHLDAGIHILDSWFFDFYFFCRAGLKFGISAGHTVEHTSFPMPRRSQRQNGR